jgi:hypothetical protein
MRSRLERRCLRALALVAVAIAVLGCEPASVENADDAGLCRVGLLIQVTAAQVDEALAAVEAGRVAAGAEIATLALAELDAEDGALADVVEGGVLEEDVQDLELAIVNLQQVAIFLSSSPSSDAPELPAVRRVLSDANGVAAALPAIYRRYDADC